MSQPKVLAFAGSAREGSYNKLLVQAAARGAETAGAKVTFVDLRDLPMPLYDADLESRDGMPENAKKFKQLLADHDALLIASPENNSSLSALLKNVIDWASRPIAKENGLADFDGKVAAIMSASPGGLGGLRGLVHLRAILENIRVMVIPDQRAVPTAHQAFDTDGAMADPKLRDAIEGIGAKLTKTAAKLIA